MKGRRCGTENGLSGRSKDGTKEREGRCGRSSAQRWDDGARGRGKLAPNSGCRQNGRVDEDTKARVTNDERAQNQAAVAKHDKAAISKQGAKRADAKEGSGSAGGSERQRTRC